MGKNYTIRHYIVEALQYTGDNLEEVLNFTGKHPNWEQWFTSFDEYKKYVEENGNVFKVISPMFTEHAVPGDFIVRDKVNSTVHVFKSDTFNEFFSPYIQYGKVESLK